MFYIAHLVEPMKYSQQYKLWKVLTYYFQQKLSIFRLYGDFGVMALKAISVTQMSTQTNKHLVVKMASHNVYISR